MDASTTGSAQQHKIKTINVEVNMLDAWVVQRVELEGKVLRKLLLLAGILVASVVVIPSLASVGAEKAHGLRIAESTLANQVRERDDLEKRAKEAAPGIARDMIVMRCHDYSGYFLQELARVINAAPEQMYFEQMQVEVTGGDSTIKVVANAVHAEVGRYFVSEAGKGPNVQSSTQTSVKQSQLSETAIKFDYIKKVSLGQ